MLRWLATPLAVLVLTSCGPQQYLAIPGAYAVADTTQVSGTAQAPSVTVTQGSSDLVVGQSVTLTVNFTSVTEIAVTEILVIVAPSAEEWVYVLSADELAAGSADLEVQAVDSKPAAAACGVNTKYHQNGWCAQPADEGATDAAMWVANDTTGSGATLIPLVLPSAGGGSSPDACSSFTFADCCPGGGALSCAVDPACQCPSGTGGGDIGGDGYRQCTCG